MLKISKLLVVIGVVIFSYTCSAETLPSPAAARELTEKVMALVVKGNIQEGIRLLKPYSTVIPDAEIEAAIGQVELQIPGMNKRFGKTLGSEFIKEDTAGDSIIRIIQLHKFEKHAMRWVFFFYRGNDGWQLNTFFFDDNIRAVFPN